MHCRPPLLVPKQRRLRERLERAGMSRVRRLLRRRAAPEGLGACARERAGPSVQGLGGVLLPRLPVLGELATVFEDPVDRKHVELA